MRKKILLIIAVAVMLCFTACSSENQEQSTEEQSTEQEVGWSKDDFNVYDADGNLYDYPLNSFIKFDSFGEDAGNYTLARGLGEYKKAKVVLENYDLTGAYVSVSKWPVMGSLDEAQLEIEEKYLSNYPEPNESVKHTSELGSLSLYVSIKFYILDDQLIVAEVNELGHVVEAEKELYENNEHYYISFYIINGEIRYLTVDNRTP